MLKPDIIYDHYLNFFQGFKLRNQDPLTKITSEPEPIMDILSREEDSMDLSLLYSNTYSPESSGLQT